MGPDMAPEDGFIKGNAISLMLNCTSEEDTIITFEKLSRAEQLKIHYKILFWAHCLETLRTSLATIGF